MYQRELDCNEKLIENLEYMIMAYKHICRLAEVPEILIEYPQIIFPTKPSDEDMKWAYSAIKEYERLKALPQDAKDKAKNSD